MQQVDVDAPEAPQALVELALEVAPVEPRRPARRRRAAAALRDDDRVPSRVRRRRRVPQPGPEDPLGFAPAVDRGRVEGRDAQVPRLRQELERLGRLVHSVPAGRP